MKNTPTETTNDQPTTKAPRPENQNLKAFKRVKDYETGKETTLFLKVCTNCKNEFVTHKRDTQTCSDECQKDNKIRGGGRHIFYTKRKDVENDFNLAKHYERNANNGKIFDIVGMNERIKEEYKNKKNYLVCMFYLSNSNFQNPEYKNENIKVFKTSNIPCLVYFDKKHYCEGLFCFLNNYHAQEFENYLYTEREKLINTFGKGSEKKVLKDEHFNNIFVKLFFDNYTIKIGNNLVFTLENIFGDFFDFEGIRKNFTFHQTKKFCDPLQIIKLDFVSNILEEKQALEEETEELNDLVEYYKNEIEYYRNALYKSYEEQNKKIREFSNKISSEMNNKFSEK